MSDASRDLQALAHQHQGDPELLWALVPVMPFWLVQQLAWALSVHERSPRLASLLSELERMEGEDDWDRIRRRVLDLAGPGERRILRIAEAVPQPERERLILEMVKDLVMRGSFQGSFGAGESEKVAYFPSEPKEERTSAKPPAPPQPAPEKAPPASSPERLVQTGFALPERPGEPIPPTEALRYRTPHLFWLEVGPPVAGAIDSERVSLPDDIPAGARIEVALFGFPDGIEIDPEADVGVLRINEKGAVEVERQPSGIGDVGDVGGDRRLFFPIRTPMEEGVAKLRCNLYCKQVLILSLLVEAVIAGRTRTDPPVLNEKGWRLLSRPDYKLSQSLSSSHLGQLGEHRLSVMSNDNGNGSHGFRFFGTDGVERLKSDVSIDGQTLQDAIRLGREALRRVAWGDPGEWSPARQYRYEKPLTKAETAADLARLAIVGYRLYTLLARQLGGGDRAKFETIVRESGRVQIALRESPRLVVPAAILYDLHWDTNAFQVSSTEFHLCEGFTADERCACFHGGCPTRGRSEAIRADPSRSMKELGPVICPSAFWGFRHAIGLPVSVATAPDAPQHIPFHGAPAMALGVSTDPAFHLLAAHEAALQALRANLGWERAATREDVLAMLRMTRAQLVYFYCHGGVIADRTPYIEVGYGESGITPDNLPSRGIVWTDPRPLVFINGCHTTALEPEVALNLVSAFVEDAAAAGVIGTEITVFEPLARDFAEACLRRFLNGVAIGDAVRGARLELLKKGNPLGLAYIPFALASLDLIEQPR
jgi:hypothetical protein